MIDGLYYMYITLWILYGYDVYIMVMFCIYSCLRWLGSLLFKD